MIEVRGRTGLVQYTNGQVVIVADTYVSAAPFSVALSEVSKVDLIRVDDELFGLDIFFCAAEVVLDGVALRREPFRLLVGEDLLPDALALACALRDGIIAGRRVRRPTRHLVSPPSVLANGETRRADVDDAAARLPAGHRAEGAIAAMHRYARSDEGVLDMAVAAYQPQAGPFWQSGLIIATTLRVLFVPLLRGGTCSLEMPIASVQKATLDVGASGQPLILKIVDGFAGIQLTGSNYPAFARVANAINLAAEVEAHDGLVAPVTPSPVTLFEEWRVLCEQRELGVMSEEEFQRAGRGIIRALPD